MKNTDVAVIRINTCMYIAYAVRRGIVCQVWIDRSYAITMHQQHWSNSRNVRCVNHAHTTVKR